MFDGSCSEDWAFCIEKLEKGKVNSKQLMCSLGTLINEPILPLFAIFFVYRFQTGMFDGSCSEDWAFCIEKLEKGKVNSK